MKCTVKGFAAAVSFWVGLSACAGGIPTFDTAQFAQMQQQFKQLQEQYKTLREQYKGTLSLVKCALLKWPHFEVAIGRNVTVSSTRNHCF